MSKSEKIKQLLLDYSLTKCSKIKEQLVKENIGLVVTQLKKLNRKCSFNHIDYDELFQEGLVGLVKAINDYDIKSGNAFSSYAVPKILGAMQQLLRDKATVIRIPQKTQEALYKQDVGILQSKKKKKLSLFQQQQEAPLNLADVKKQYNNILFHKSLETPVDDDSNTTLGDLIKSETKSDFSEALLEVNVSLLSKKRQSLYQTRIDGWCQMINKNMSQKTYDIISSKTNQLSLFD